MYIYTGARMPAPGILPLPAIPFSCAMRPIIAQLERRDLKLAALDGARERVPPCH